MNLVNKTVNLNLVGDEDLLTYFKKQATRAGWSKEEIQTVVDEATAGDYDHQVSVLLEHSSVGEFEELSDEDYEFEEDESNITY